MKFRVAVVAGKDGKLAVRKDFVDLGCCLQAIHFGHHVIQQGTVGLVCRCFRYGILSVRSGFERIAVSMQYVVEKASVPSSSSASRILGVSEEMATESFSDARLSYVNPKYPELYW